MFFFYFVLRDQAVKSVTWPPMLEELTFGYSFNGVVEGAVWPNGLRRMMFGVSFDRNVEAVAWPTGLEQVTYLMIVCDLSLRGLSFDQLQRGQHHVADGARE